MRKRLCLYFLLLLGVSLSAVGRTKAPIRVACIGNSITYGYGLQDRDREAYPVLLQQFLGAKYQVENFGKSGATLLARGHRPYFQQEEYHRALAFRPDIAVIHLGVNDTDPRNWPNYRDEFIPDYRHLIDTLRSISPRVRILIARTTPIGVEHPRFESGTRDWQLQIQQAIEQVAETAGVELIDFHSPLYPFPHYFPDAVHPTAPGTRILAETAYRAISGNYGGLQLPSIYSDGMVLQRERPLTLRGTADAGEEVTLSFRGWRGRAKTSRLGEWTITLPAQSAGGPYTLEVGTSRRRIQLHSVYVGEVWLCSGQSNMAFTLGESRDEEHRPIQPDSLLRIYSMEPAHETTATAWPLSFLDSLDQLRYYRPTSWTGASPSRANISAIAYHFARELRDSLKIPVGIVVNAIGGSPTEAWIDRATLEMKLPAILRHWRTNDFIMPWVRERAGQNLEARSTPLARHPYAPTYLYDTGIRPLKGFAFRGALWYQGESNAHNVEAHEALFPLLVDSWRKTFGAKLPFYYVQLSSMERPSWPAFRDSQRRLARPQDGVEMVVSLDHGLKTDVHPRLKYPIGHRLAQLALSRQYGYSSLESRSPEVQLLTLQPQALLISFSGTTQLRTSDGADLRGFELVTREGKAYPLSGTIQGQTVTLRLPASL
ncbi:GDSL-type esterase/lipase family protein, partial [uncultured Porphyromonas sp.]|uniref:GDSL-type esterase/lipase family protein n=1 Tax=uncultured Porphyromonas sp. TaxID=159274 RepID=UPI002638097A